ncbi:ABC transporter substrate-binding protein [Paenibacillus sp. FSL R5-0475]|uniref:ABC transporter substrate-binding protein n=1 Tax=Paenibacillus sp. FSL R5-0475 TaxID=2921643 RepID=UPI0030F9E127
MFKRSIFVLLMGALIMTTACNSGGNEKVESKGKTTTEEGKTILTLSLAESSAFYQALEKKFEAKYPDIDLQIKAYKEVGNEWGENGYVEYKKTTNTALLSGKGADIFDISAFSINDYVSKKLLVNMNDIFEHDKTVNKSDLEMNVLDAMKVNDGLYFIPTGFAFRAFIGDGNMIKNSNVKIDDKNWTWKEFGEQSKEIIQQAGKDAKNKLYALTEYPAEMTLQEMAIDNYNLFVDSEAKQAKFDSPDFVELLEQVKKMYKEQVMTSEPAEIGNQLFNSIVIWSPTDFIDGPYSYFENPVYLQKPHAGQTGGMRIIPSSSLAIQANTPVKEEAYKFMTFLLSEEAQSLQDREGFSLLQSVNDKNLNDVQEKVESGAYKLPTGKAAKVSDEEFTKFKEIIHTVDQYAELDTKVLSIIGEESSSFFSGQKSAEDVAKLIQNRVATVLNE